MMFTIDRIRRLLTFCGLGETNLPAHDTLDMIDTMMSVDTKFNHRGHCKCLTYLGICEHRRPVGARLALLEECMATDYDRNPLHRADPAPA